MTPSIINKWLLFLCLSITAAASRAQEPVSLFSGEKTSWREGFDRYDFLMDELTLEVTPIKATEEEKYGAKAAERGKFHCIVVAPKKAAPGNPWSWRGYYWDHEPQTEVELLKRGFHIAYIMDDADRHWDAWYAFLMKHGLNPKPAFVGMSRGGINEFVWAATHPDKVACIYTDNPALRPESFDGLPGMARHDIPLLHVVGSYDFLLEKYTLPVEDIYHQLGGRISLIIKEGPPHHPHSLKDPTLIAGWIEANYHHGDDLTDSLYAISPLLPGTRLIKSYYYSNENKYLAILPESTYAVCRGPLFTDCYTRYDSYTPNWLGLTGMTILVPKQPAPGNPWVFKADRIGRETEPVDLALLAKGFYIVAAPVTEQPGPIRKQWDDIYQLLTSHGFSTKPVMEGRGAGGGEAYYWAINNPEKVSAIYAENPVLKSLQTKLPLTDTLAALASAHIPILHACGSLDPWYPGNTKEVEKKYRQLGGSMKVIVSQGAGHFNVIQDPAPIVSFILNSQH
ncbi:MAG TPA: alpha/beta hydrolase [Puia sp.]|jgi:pimeloyl-ACP methyl ester carboxylesterase|nr:alpha/beta hydrolase [Puia sp.]